MSRITLTSKTSTDAAGNVIKKNLPGGLTSFMEYDEFGNLIRQTLPKGVNYQARYNSRGLLVEEWSGNQLPTYYYYDELGRNIGITDADNQITTLSYDEFGNLSRTVDPASDEFFALHDERGMVVYERNSRGKEWIYAYDANGNLSGSIDPRQTIAVYDYDERNLLEEINYTNTGEGLSHSQMFEYDEAGQIKTASDNGVVTTYNSKPGAYLSDPYGLIRSVSTVGYGTAFETSYDYDTMLRMTETRYSDTHSARYNYNNLGQLESMPLYIDQLNYNEAGLLSDYNMTNGVELNYNYDANYRLSSMSYSNDEGTLKSYRFAYDMDDNIIEKNDDYYSYDRLGRLQSAMIIGDAGSKTWEPDTSQRSYGVVQNDVLGTKPLSLQGEELQLSTTADSMVIDTGFGYSVQSVEIPLQNIDTQNLSPDMFQVFTALYNGNSAYQHHDDARIELTETSITITFSSPVFTRYIKLHSTIHTLNDDGTPKPLGSILTANTDTIKVTALTGGSNEFYNYTPDGNRSQKSILAGSMTNDPYRYYANSDLVKTANGFTYRYDANGNLIEKGTSATTNGDEVTIHHEGQYTRYHWDLLNRLVKVERLNDQGQLVTVSEYGYDINNLRIYKHNEDGEETHYVYDINGNRIEKHTEGQSEYYIFRKLRHVAKRVVDADTHNHTTYFYSTDHLGSTVLVTNFMGDEVWSGETNPFGDSVSGSGVLSDEERVKYTGKDFDEDIGLYYFNARWYDAEIGRFISEDPARDGGNWFSYVSSNPLKYSDPTGLEQVSWGNQIFDTEEYEETGDVNEATTDVATYEEQLEEINEVKETKAAQAQINSQTKELAELLNRDVSQMSLEEYLEYKEELERTAEELLQGIEDYEAAGYEISGIGYSSAQIQNPMDLRSSDPQSKQVYEEINFWERYGDAILVITSGVVLTGFSGYAIVQTGGTATPAMGNTFVAGVQLIGLGVGMVIDESINARDVIKYTFVPEVEGY